MKEEEVSGVVVLVMRWLLVLSGGWNCGWSCWSTSRTRGLMGASLLPPALMGLLRAGSEGGGTARARESTKGLLRVVFAYVCVCVSVNLIFCVSVNLIFIERPCYLKR